MWPYNGGAEYTWAVKGAIFVLHRKRYKTGRADNGVTFCDQWPIWPTSEL